MNRWQRVMPNGHGANRGRAPSRIGVTAAVLVASVVSTLGALIGPARVASASVATSATMSETVGGLTHTWSDYTDAGGTQGPSIKANTTVRVGCRTIGFAVADGNSWWYQIASAPWDNKFWASADAFYNNGHKAGTLIGTPFYDTKVPVCSGTTGPYPETTGSVAHTWTDYSNAGGTEGPEIAQHQTVQIACTVQGFKVADGNTWWYQIASSPWSKGYYVSADALYNNGHIKGRLAGTPFVDAAVPLCTSTSHDYAETVGPGGANTWTDYTDAGGTEGPTIEAYQTVDVTCWVSGFKVADGNTYWYQIASSPWNDHHYASADAFYNNGQTSGSLRGTPFVDPKVLACESSS